MDEQLEQLRQILTDGFTDYGMPEGEVAEITDLVIDLIRQAGWPRKEQD